MTNTHALLLAKQYGLSNENLGYIDFEELLLRFIAELLTHYELEKQAPEFVTFEGRC